jgi:TAT (twin-arginine translocation) pathway signal sequence
MTDDSHADELPRRQFIKLSVGAGAAAVLAGAAPAAAPSLASPAQPNLCGNDNDKGKGFKLWEKAQDCNANPQNPMCLAIDQKQGYVVLNGAPQG